MKKNKRRKRQINTNETMMPDKTKQVEQIKISQEETSEIIRNAVYDAHFEVQREEERIRKEKSFFTKAKEKGKKWVEEGIKRFVFVTIVTGLLTYSYNAFTKHAFEVDEISISITDDKNVINSTSNNKIMKYMELDENCVKKDTVSLAPEIEVNVTNKGKYNSVYLYYRSDAYDDFVIQKLQMNDDRFINAIPCEESCKVTLNYMLSAQKNINFVYIIFIDNNATPTIYVTYIDSDLKNMNPNLEIKSLDDIYELVPDRESDIWSLDKMYIIEETSQIIKNLP